MALAVTEDAVQALRARFPSQRLEAFGHVAVDGVASAHPGRGVVPDTSCTMFGSSPTIW